MGQSAHLHDVPAPSIKPSFYNSSLPVSLTPLCSECEIPSSENAGLSAPLSPSVQARGREGAGHTQCPRPGGEADQNSLGS